MPTEAPLGWSVKWKHAGLLTLWFGRYGLHIFPSREHWLWGYRKSWYDGTLSDFGLGPLALLSWTEVHDAS